MNAVMPRNEAEAVDAAFRAALDQDWGRVAALVAAHPALLGNISMPMPWPPSRPISMMGTVGLVTWAPNDSAFVVEAPSEQFARWLGFREAADVAMEVLWHGTRKIGLGRWAAQFTVSEEGK